MATSARIDQRENFPIVVAICHPSQSVSRAGRVGCKRQATDTRTFAATHLAYTLNVTMGLLPWIQKKRAAGGGSELPHWRRQWREACAAPSREGIEALRRSLAALGLPEEEIEIEREMLEGIEQLAVIRDTSATGLPVMATGHRVVGSDTCHFTAPVSMPDEAAQPSGRLILTSARAIFAGGASAVSVPWHAVARVLHQERDLVLVRRDREALHRFRCNVFGDVLTAAFLAETLAGRHQRQRSV